MALLAGDALLTLSFQVLAGSSLEDKIKVTLMERLASRAGKKGMAGGQAKDILGSKERLLMLRQKTGDLMSCSLEFGALIARAEPQYEQAMRELGLALGVVYQLRDDQEDADGVLEKESSDLLLQETLQKVEEICSQLPFQAFPIKSLLPLFKVSL
jgi:geranylgeranyl pyrophosphate synthase